MMEKYIFEIELITFGFCEEDIDANKPYPFNISNTGRYFAFSFNEAEELIRNFPKSTKERVYRFILRKLPIGERLYPQEFVCLWVYDKDGNLIDKSVCADFLGRGDQSQCQFTGRIAAELRFKLGDIVEWFRGKTVRLGIVTGVPLSPERCSEIMERACSKKLGTMLDTSDDSYTVVYGPDVSYHDHIFSPFVSMPSFPVPDKMRQQLEETYRRID